MPDFKRMVRPITALLGEQGGGVWEARHTEALNAIAEVVYRRLKLGLVDMSWGVLQWSVPREQSLPQSSTR